MIIDYNADWQYPAITEQWAFEKMKEYSFKTDKFVYLAFPWATLIDSLIKKANNWHDKEIKSLMANLTECRNQIKGKKRVVTVCQHIHMLKYQELFANSGVTDIFWSHAAKDESRLSKFKNITIHPFPLYPVQQIAEKKIQKKYLYSFVGAKSNKWYLAKTRNIILDILKDDPRGFIKGRDAWHFNKVVYEKQIKGILNSSDGAINEKDTDEFGKILSQSIFSLCPSGTGPNSIRLWESIYAGVIPVILSDSYQHPGDSSLWKEATIQCGESSEEISQLPDRLEELSKDSEFLDQKLNALRQLKFIYGPDFFVYEVLKLQIEDECINKHKFTFSNEIEYYLKQNIHDLTFEQANFLFTSIASAILTKRCTLESLCAQPHVLNFLKKSIELKILEEQNRKILNKICLRDKVYLFEDN